MTTISLDNSGHETQKRSRHFQDPAMNDDVRFNNNNNNNHHFQDRAYDTSVTDDVAIFIDDSVDDPAVAMALTHSPVAVAMLSSPGATKRLQQQMQQYHNNNTNNTRDDDEQGSDMIDLGQISTISSFEEILEKPSTLSSLQSRNGNNHNFTTTGRSSSMKGINSENSHNNGPCTPKYPPSSSHTGSEVFQTPPTKTMMNHYQRSHLPVPVINNNNNNGTTDASYGLQVLQQINKNNSLATIGTPSRKNNNNNDNNSDAQKLVGKDATMLERVALRRFAQDRTNTPNHTKISGSTSTTMTPQKTVGLSLLQPPLTSPSKFQHTDTTCTPNRYRNNNNNNTNSENNNHQLHLHSNGNTNHGVTAASSAFFASLMEKKLASISNQFNHLNHQPQQQQQQQQQMQRKDTPSPSPDKRAAQHESNYFYNSSDEGHDEENESDYYYDHREEASHPANNNNNNNTHTNHNIRATSSSLSGTTRALAVFTSPEQLKGTGIFNNNNNNIAIGSHVDEEVATETTDASCSPVAHIAQKDQQIIEKMIQEMAVLRKDNSRLQTMFEHQKQLANDAETCREELDEKLQAKIMEAIGLASRLDESKRFVRQLKKESHENRIRTLNFANSATGTNATKSAALDEGQIEKIIEPRIAAAVRNVEMRYLAVIRDQQDRIQALEELLGSEESSMTKIAEASMVRNRRLVDEVAAAQKSERLALERLVTLRREHDDRLKDQAERHEQLRDQLKTSQRALTSEREYVDELLSAIEQMRVEMDALKDDHEQLLGTLEHLQMQQQQQQKESRPHHSASSSGNSVSDVKRAIVVDREDQQDDDDDDEVEFEIDDEDENGVHGDDDDTNAEIHKHVNRARSLSPQNNQSNAPPPAALSLMRSL